jgi:hypothetical protein
MHKMGALSPTGCADAALVEKAARGSTRKAETGEAAAVQQGGVLDNRNERETCFDALGFGVVGSLKDALSQGGQADMINAGESEGSLDPRTTRAEAATGHLTVALRNHRSFEYAAGPQPQDHGS